MLNLLVTVATEVNCGQAQLGKAIPHPSMKDNINTSIKYALMSNLRITAWDANGLTNHVREIEIFLLINFIALL